MPRYRYGQTEERIAKWHAQGRGLGSGATYKPWLRVQDVPSHGRVHRVPSRFGRVVHLMSDIEYAAFLDFEGKPSVVDVREQFPLPRAETIAIAEQLGVAHPKNRGTIIVMTTDLVVDWRGGGLTPVAAKAVADLANPRVQEKLDIEREWWTRRGRGWALVTDRETSLDRRVLAGSLVGWREDEVDDPGKWMARAGALLVSLVDAAPLRLIDFVRGIKAERGWPAGDAIAALRYLLANKAIRLVGREDLDFNGPLDQFELVANVGA